MGVFVQAPFWAQDFTPAGAPHAVSVRVTPAITIVSSSVASPTIITTSTPHGLVSGDTATITGHTGSTPAISGAQTVTVLTPTTFTVPINVTVGGTGGTVTRTTAIDPLTLAQAKTYARLTGTDLDSILPGVITTARLKVQQDTGIVLLTDTYDVYFDALPTDRTPIALPWRPVASLVSFSSIDTAGVTQTLAASNYVLDPSSETPIAARVALSVSGAWPTDLRPFQPYVIRLVAGFASIAAIPAPLVHAVGLLVDAYVNKLSLDEYETTIAPYRLVTVA